MSRSGHQIDATWLFLLLIQLGRIHIRDEEAVRIKKKAGGNELRNRPSRVTSMRLLADARSGRELGWGDLTQLRPAQAPWRATAHAESKSAPVAMINPPVGKSLGRRRRRQKNPDR